MFLRTNLSSVHVQAHFMGTKLLCPMAQQLGGARMATSLIIQLYFHIWQLCDNAGPTPNIALPLNYSTTFHLCLHHHVSGCGHRAHTYLSSASKISL